MPVIRRPLGQGVVMLGGLLQELDVVLLYVVVGPGGGSSQAVKQCQMWFAASQQTCVHFLTQENPVFHFVEIKTNIYPVNDKYIFPSQTRLFV